MALTSTEILETLQQQGLIKRDKKRHLIIAKDAFVSSSHLWVYVPQ